MTRPSLLLTALALIAGCEERHALNLTVLAAKTSFVVDTFELSVREVERGEDVLRREDDIAAGRDISVRGQEWTGTVELGGPGTYLVHFLGWSRARPTAGRQLGLQGYRVEGELDRYLQLVPLTNDVDGDSFPACGSPAWSDCSGLACKYLDCDDNDANVHPLAAEVCQNGKDDDCSAGCGAGPGAGDVKCTE